MQTAQDTKDAAKASTAVDNNGSGTKPPVRQLIPIEKLKANPDQVRQQWDTAKDELGRNALDRLAESIRNQGLLSDLVVTPEGDHFLIVCGERRYRAIRNHNLMKEVPCIVRENLTPTQMLEMNIVENLQREDLTPIDEAHAYQALMEKCGYTQVALAKKLGISGAMISYRLSLLNLSTPLQKMVAQGKISETDGRSIVQHVNRIQGPQQTEQRATALKNIEKEIEKEPANPKTGKVETPAVQRVAQKAVTEVAGAKALPQVRAPKVTAPAPAPAPVSTAKVNAAVKEQAEHLITVLKDITELLRPARRALADRKFRLQVIQYVLEQQPMLPSRIQAAISPLDVIHNEAKALLDEKARGGNAPKTAPAKAASAKTAKKQAKTKAKAAKKTKARK